MLQVLAAVDSESRLLKSWKGLCAMISGFKAEMKAALEKQTVWQGKICRKVSVAVSSCKRQCSNRYAIASCMSDVDPAQLAKGQLRICQDDTSSLKKQALNYVFKDLMNSLILPCR